MKRTGFMIQKLMLLFIVFGGIAFTSCDNELDINGEYQDINIIYGVLSPNSQRQYIRINRAFLTEGNVFEAASIPDSSNYPYMLNVSIQEFDENNQLVNTFVLDTVHIRKDDGAFNVGWQPYYYFDLPGIYSTIQYNDMTYDTLYMNPNNYFKLLIQNPRSGEISESETKMIPDFSITKPAPYNKFVSFTSDTRASVEFKSAEYGKLYEAKFIFYYREVYASNPTDTIVKEIIWNLGSVKSSRLTGGESLEIGYTPYTFFNILKSKIPELPDVTRWHGKMTSGQRIDIQLVMTVGADELSTYMDVNKPSGSIIQDKPLYTNIVNGIGIFSSKRVVRLNYYLNYITVDSLRNGSVWYMNFQ